MQLTNKIKSVNNLFLSLDKRVDKFKKESGLSCVEGCGECCLKNDISSTALEFLPAAYHLYLNNKHDAVLEKIEKNTDSICVFYSLYNGKGFCSHYSNRGLICRLFGYSVRPDKHNELTLVTCKHIKKGVNYENLSKTISNAPWISHYYFRLFNIDPKQSNTFLPINMAIKQALEEVLLYFQYRKRRA